MITRAALTASCLLLSGLCHARDAEAEALLKKMRQAYAAVKTAKLTARAKITGPVDASISQQMSFMAPNMVRATVAVKQSSATLDLNVTTDGKQIHIAMAGGPSRTGKYDMEAVNSAVAGNLEVLSFWDWKRQLSTEKGANMNESSLKVAKETWKGKTWTVLEESVAQHDIFARYFVDPKTNLIWRVTQARLKSKTPIGEWELTKLELNPKLSQATFTPPAASGTRV